MKIQGFLFPPTLLKKLALAEKNSGNGTRRRARRTTAWRDRKRNARQRGRHGEHGRTDAKTHGKRREWADNPARGDQPAAARRCHRASSGQAEQASAATSGKGRAARGARHHDHAGTARPGRPSRAAGRKPGDEDKQGRHYAATPQRAANTEASRREARPRPTETGGGATGTETAKPPGTGRTTHPKQAGGKRRPQEHAKRPAAAAEENRATATKPDRERSDGRNEMPSAPPAQGANPARAERTTDEAAGNNEKEATGHPQGRGPPGTGGTHPPPAKASRPDRDTRKGA